MNRLLALTVALLLGVACNPGRDQSLRDAGERGGAALTEKEAAVPEPQFRKHLQLGYGFEVKAGGYEQLGHLETYTRVVVSRNGKEVFKDSSLTEYTFSHKSYPEVMPAGPEAFELLLQVNDRPNPDYLRWVRIERNALTKTGELPLFIGEAADLDGDKALERAGYWGGGEVWGENYRLTAYNPILYYETSPGGLRLDSALTRAKNRAIYGEFHGFDFSQAIPVPAARLENFDQEVSRIEASAIPAKTGF
ncbi:MAG: hypothetical protein AVDCRST_MAG56-3097 [uncultured Cytophagales bacterium]|uniref:Uncharacterized protein n=1 Tax=uncultured Cytophagales bacterium TaxID=158755 RepID=A0A6J4J9L5_9SPHI|nr:MAG: hypothetical protein AVDCRST_MAG56-3097 [uncultured Cytophagales bacterium]